MTHGGKVFEPTSQRAMFKRFLETERKKDQQSNGKKWQQT